MTVEALLERYNDTRRVVLDSLERLNGGGWSAVQHRVTIVDSRENQAAS